MRDTLQYKPRPEGWANFTGDRGKWHYFGADGRSLCGKWANMTRNILEKGNDDSDANCAACRRKLRNRKSRP